MASILTIGNGPLGRHLGAPRLISTDALQMMQSKNGKFRQICLALKRLKATLEKRFLYVFGRLFKESHISKTKN